MPRRPSPPTSTPPWAWAVGTVSGCVPGGSIPPARPRRHPTVRPRSDSCPARSPPVRRAGGGGQRSGASMCMCPAPRRPRSFRRTGRPRRQAFPDDRWTPYWSSALGAGLPSAARTRDLVVEHVTDWQRAIGWAQVDRPPLGAAFGDRLPVRAPNPTPARAGGGGRMSNVFTRRYRWFRRRSNRRRRRCGSAWPRRGPGRRADGRQRAPSPYDLGLPACPALSAAATTAGAAAGFTAAVAPGDDVQRPHLWGPGRHLPFSSGRTLPLKGAPSPLAAAAAVPCRTWRRSRSTSAVPAPPAPNRCLPGRASCNVDVHSLRPDLAGLAVAAAPPPAASAWLERCWSRPGSQRTVVSPTQAARR